jgi:hypothetical protein
MEEWREAAIQHCRYKARESLLHLPKPLSTPHKPPTVHHPLYSSCFYSALSTPIGFSAISRQSSRKVTHVLSYVIEQEMRISSHTMFKSVARYVKKKVVLDIVNTGRQIQHINEKSSKQHQHRHHTITPSENIINRIHPLK